QASMPISPSESPVLRTLTYAHDENMFPREPEGGSDLVDTLFWKKGMLLLI
ncbi:hypothetical protein L195_g060120, partial [Trifolium pratense]